MNSLLEKTKELIERYTIIPNSINYGQHFLVDEKTVEIFLSQSQLVGKESVLEIGPGLGTLSEELAKKSRAVTLVEIDSQFKKPLENIQKKYRNITVLFENVLELPSFQYDLVCGALSYSIFEPLILRLVFANEFTRGVFMVSNKFAEDFKKKNTRLTTLVDTFFTVTIVEELPPTFFYPEPRTPGVLISLNRVGIKNKSQSLWYELFMQHDKKIKNALRESLIRVSKLQGITLTKKEAIKLLENELDEIWMQKKILQLSDSEFTQLSRIVHPLSSR